MSKKRGTAWKPRLSREAQQDYADIMNWTIRTFGSRQAERYGALFQEAHSRLATDPFAGPSKARNDLGAALHTLHLSRPGRHILIYRVEGVRVVIVRILHDSMELARHMPGEE